MICKKTMSRCTTPNMCAPFHGCELIEQGLKAQNATIERLERELAEARSQYTGLQSVWSSLLEKHAILEAERDALQRRHIERDALDEQQAAATARLVDDLALANSDRATAWAECRALRKDAERYHLLRRGQHWSVINGIGDTLRANELDAAIDAARVSLPIE